MRFTSGRGVDIVYDAVGKDTFEQSVECLAPRGHLVSFGQASGDVGTQSIDRLASRCANQATGNCRACRIRQRYLQLDALLRQYNGVRD